MIETLEDIVEELANNLGIYGAHGEEHPDGQCECRVCFSIQLRGRIEAAVEVDRRQVLNSQELLPVLDIMAALKDGLAAIKPKPKPKRKRKADPAGKIPGGCESCGAAHLTGCACG